MNNYIPLMEALNILESIRKQLEQLPNSNEKARYLVSLGVFAINILRDDQLFRQEQIMILEQLQKSGCVVTDSGTIQVSKLEEYLEEDLLIILQHASYKVMATGFEVVFVQIYKSEKLGRILKKVGYHKVGELDPVYNL